MHPFSIPFQLGSGGEDPYSSGEIWHFDITTRNSNLRSGPIGLATDCLPKNKSDEIWCYPGNENIIAAELKMHF